jgi:hypothetical protein
MNYQTGLQRKQEDDIWYHSDDDGVDDRSYLDVKIVDKSINVRFLDDVTRYDDVEYDDE